MRCFRAQGSLALVLVLSAASLLPSPAAAHPGSGIVVDRLGQIFFVDMVSGVWKLDVHGALTQVSSPWAPTGVALFGGDLYVLEFQNANSENRREMLPRVRKIEADGKTAVLATVSRH